MLKVWLIKSSKLIITNKNEKYDVDYVNLDCIMGSAAVVERLWSITNGGVDRERNISLFLLMEALLY